MIVASSIAEMRAERDRLEGTVGFVPTMGALHRGHLSLVDLVLEEADTVVASVFVNPLQFGPSEDLARYPRDEEGDLRSLEDAGVDVVFLPGVKEMYPDATQITVSSGRLGQIYEGAHRPGHMDGVATVVTKLFNIVRPDVAAFGQKDAQQVALIRSLVRDLDIPVRIVVGPTVRDADGLALSSRNAYLSAPERATATRLHAALREGAAALENGSDLEDARRAVESVLAQTPGVSVDYVATVDPETFEEPRPGQPVLIALAAGVGTTRLIDNLVVDRGTRSGRPGL